MKRNKLLSGLLITLLFLLFSGVTEPKAIAAPQNNITIVGEEKAIGNGKVRTWLQVDQETKKPVSIGVSLSESALSGLPADSDLPQKDSLKLQLMDGSPDHTFEYELGFPSEVTETAFTHMGFNWNPVGHGPEDVFDLPHFDVHFYMASPEYRHDIEFDVKKIGDAFEVETSNLEPPREFLPENFRLAPNTAEPRMGSHYADVTSPQLQPGNFDNVFLFGVHNGSILFWEPMLTLDYLKSQPNFSQKLSLPEAYPVSGYYPTAYSVVYDQKRKEIDISLDGLTFRVASYPNDVYAVDHCMDSRIARYIAKYQEIPEATDITQCLNLLGKEGLISGLKFLDAHES